MRLGRKTQRLLVLGMVAGLCACSDGYPTDDDPLSDPMTLSQAERIEAMNDLGRHAHPALRWRYTLAEHCTLEVEVRPGDAGRGPASARLGIKDVRLRYDQAKRLYEVQLRRRAPNGQPALAVLESVQHLDSLLMSGLLRAVQVGCREAGR